MKTIEQNERRELKKIAIKIIYSVLILAGVFILYEAFLKKDPSKILNTVNKETFIVSTEKAERRDLKHQLLTSGSLKALEEATLFPRVSGKLLRNVLREGDKVKKNQTVSLIERDEVGAVYEPVVVPSTINGVVARVYLDPGANVTTGTPVALVVNQDIIRIAVDIPERYAGELHKGQSAWLTVEALPQQKFEAKLDIISPVVDAQSRSVAVEFKADNKSKKLLAGMFARVDISLAEQKKALSISKKSIYENEDGTAYVFVPSADGKTAEKKNIKVGFKNMDHWQVLDGLREGDTILQFAYGLKEGDQIEIK